MEKEQKQGVERNLTFDDVLEDLHKGKKVRNRDWKQGFHLIFDQTIKSIFQVTPNGTLWSWVAVYKDKFSKNWEVVDEK